MRAGEIWRFLRLRWTALMIAGGLVLLVASVAGAFNGPAPTGDGVGVRRFLTPEVVGATRIGEEFVMNRAGLRSIAIRAAAVGPVDGDVLIELWHVRTHDALLVRHGLLKARDLVASGAYQFTFAPLPESKDVTYRLVLASSPTHPSRGVAFWATKGDRLQNATLVYGTVRRWADLAFRTDTVPPPPLRPAAVLAVLMLAASWVAFVLFLSALHSMCASPETSSEAAG
jgi:hypothetical protein